MYLVIKRFFDLRSDHAYSVGDVFPHDGVEVDAERITELAGDRNRLGVPLIREEKEAEEKTPEKPKKARAKKTENTI